MLLQERARLTDHFFYQGFGALGISVRSQQRQIDCLHPVIGITARQGTDVPSSDSAQRWVLREIGNGDLMSKKAAEHECAAARNVGKPNEYPRAAIWRSSRHPGQFRYRLHRPF